MDKLTEFAVKNPVKLMRGFHELGQKALVEIIEATSSPDSRKQLRTWGIKDAATMIGKSINTIKALENRNDVNLPTKDINGRKQYSLELINIYRDIFKTRYIRPKDTDPIVCCALNFKGGSGKSMTSLLLSQYLAIQGLNVLGIDLDPQATYTTWFGYIPDIDLSDDDTLTTTLLENENDIHRIIKKTYFTGIDIIPANLELENGELKLPNFNKDQYRKLGSPLKRLDKAIQLVKDKYDVIIIDCAPKIGALTMNAVSTINSALITLPPAMPDFASFVRLSKTLEEVFKVIKSDHLDFFRILLTKHKGNNSSNSVDRLIRKLYSEYVLFNHMVDSAEIDKTASALISLYEKSYATNSSTYKRALEMSDKVNDEILSAFKVIWETNSNHHTETKEIMYD